MIDLRERTHANEASEASGPSPLNSNTNAQQFHGQETDYVAGLSLLGLTPGGLRVGSHPLQVSGLAPIDPGLMREAIALIQRLEAIVRDSLKEYDAQNMFVRPVVKRMFQQGTGLKVEDGLARAQVMTRRLQSLDTDNCNDLAQHPALDAATVAAYLEVVRRMGHYITKQQVDARGWMKDPTQLHMALEVLRHRNETVQRLAEILTKLQQGADMSLLVGAESLIKRLVGRSSTLWDSRTLPCARRQLPAHRRVAKGG